MGQRHVGRRHARRGQGEADQLGAIGPLLVGLDLQRQAALGARGGQQRRQLVGPGDRHRRRPLRLRLRRRPGRDRRRAVHALEQRLELELLEHQAQALAIPRSRHQVVEGDPDLDLGVQRDQLARDVQLVDQRRVRETLLLLALELGDVLEDAVD